MVGSAIIGGFILGMIEGVNIMINRYSEMLMPRPLPEGKNIKFSFLINYSILSFRNIN
jgi:hypothetical protein